MQVSKNTVIRDIKKVREYMPGGSATVGAASLATRFIFGVLFPKN